MPTALIILGAALLLVPCCARLTWHDPVTITLMMWLVIGLLFAARPFNLVEPSLRVAVVVVAGLASLCLPSLLVRGPSRQVIPQQAGDGSPAHRLELHAWRLALVAGALLAAAIYGVLAYRNAVSAAVGGEGFGDLDPKLVRWAELYGEVRLSGSASLALGLVPLLGALAVIGGLCHRWWWYLLLPATLLLLAQSPSRTATLSVAVSSGFFYLVLSKAPGQRLKTRGVRLSRGRMWVLLAGAGALALAYFGYVARQLDKSNAGSELVWAPWVPDALVEPLMFLLGGVSAFTVAEEHPSAAPGPYGHFGRSMYALVKMTQGLGVDVPTPDPFASYVEIPVAFNTYTAFGDVYFDLGLAGVIGVFLAMGVVTCVLTRLSRSGHPFPVWILSTMAVALTATPVNSRFLDIDIIVQAGLGCLLLAMVLRRETTPTGPEPSRSRADTRQPGSRARTGRRAQPSLGQPAPDVDLAPGASGLEKQAGTWASLHQRHRLLPGSRTAVPLSPDPWTPGGST